MGKRKYDNTRRDADRHYNAVKNEKAGQVYFLTRELFCVLAGERKDVVKEYCAYILNEKDKDKAESNYQQLISGNLSAMNHAKILIEHGISEEFFNGTDIIAPKKVLVSLKCYMNKDSLGEYDEELDFYIPANRKKLIEEQIIPNIFDIKNKDGSLVIDCIFDIAMKILSNSKMAKNPEIHPAASYDVIDYITSLKLGANVSQLAMKKYYNHLYEEIIKEYKEDDENSKNKLIHLPDYPEKDTVTNNKLSDTNKKYIERIQNTLLIIRESFLELCEIDGHIIDDKDFYEYIGVDKNRFEQQLNETKSVNVRPIFDKIRQFGFPATLIKNDIPSEIGVSSEVIYKADEVRTSKDYKALRDTIKLYMFYKIDTYNLPFFFSVYSMYRYILESYDQVEEAAKVYSKILNLK